MEITLKDLYAVLDQLEAGRLPDPAPLAAFIEACAPELFAGPVPENAEELRREFLSEAGIEMSAVVGKAESAEYSAPVLSENERHALREDLFSRARTCAPCCPWF